MELKPVLNSSEFVFTQKANVCSSETVETIKIRCISSTGVDVDESYFFVMETKGWAIDNVKELVDLLDRVKGMVKLQLPTKIEETE